MKFITFGKPSSLSRELKEIINTLKKWAGLEQCPSVINLKKIFQIIPTLNTV